MTVTLTVEPRTVTGKALKTIRDDGKLPGIVYGPKQEATTIQMDKGVFDKMFKEAGESTIITLQGLKEDTEVLIHDVAFDPARGGVTHIDFYAIERGKELTTNVGLEFEGEAPVEKLDAVLNKVLQSVEVTCRPGVLPSHLTIDLSNVSELDSQILVKDIVLPEGVKIENNLEDVVVSVSAVVEEVEEVPEVVDMDAIEVEAKGKEDGEEDGAPESAAE